jgi:hypothetical protein
VADVCDRCDYPVVQDADGNWVHSSPADAAMCQMLVWAERGRKAQAAIDDLGAGKPGG